MGTGIKSLLNRLNQPVNIYPLAGFRILYGLLLLFSTIRFVANGWVHSMYIHPKVHFKFYAFEWVEALPQYWMYFPFALMAAAAIGIALGRAYRLSCFIFFFAFTYVELIDSTNYLNHYYFISIITFLMGCVPAHYAAALGKKDRAQFIPKWSLLVIQLQIAIVYFFAGIAKLEHSWLVEAMPLRLWLPAHNHLPLVGPLLNHTSTAYLFSWFGCVYDLAIPFILFHKRLAPWRFIAVVVFHLATAMLFPIGVFPYVMIASASIFLPTKWFENALSRSRPMVSSSQPKYAVPTALKAFFVVHFLVQTLVPFRYLLYPGNHLWTEQGFRFSWRVMLVEKAGIALFYAQNNQGQRMYFDNAQHLTAMQEKQMSFQPDMMVCYARYLKELAQRNGLQNPTIHVQSYVTLNGSPSQPFIDEAVDLSVQSNSIFEHKTYILPGP
jgi:hypothetical protein